MLAIAAQALMVLLSIWHAPRKANTACTNQAPAGALQEDSAHFASLLCGTTAGHWPKYWTSPTLASTILQFRLQPSTGQKKASAILFFLRPSTERDNAVG
jgi:hypothetical protein